jgi:hypothetical protein
LLGFILVLIKWAVADGTIGAVYYFTGAAGTGYFFTVAGTGYCFTGAGTGYYFAGAGFYLSIKL